jgi:hypothetical protein
MSAAPRPNVRRPHPLDACQRLHPCAHPVEVWEREGFQDDAPPATDWPRMYWKALALAVCVTCWSLLIWMVA